MLDLPGDLELIRGHFPDAADLDVDGLTRLVRAAETQCLAWAPVDVDATSENPNYVLAVAWQAKENHAASRRDGETINVDGYAVRVRPMLDAVKMQLRPPSAVPGIG